MIPVTGSPTVRTNQQTFMKNCEGIDNPLMRLCGEKNEQLLKGSKMKQQ
jgi:hypothetical protein